MAHDLLPHALPLISHHMILEPRLLISLNARRSMEGLLECQSRDFDPNLPPIFYVYPDEEEHVTRQVRVASVVGFASQGHSSQTEEETDLVILVPEKTRPPNKTTRPSALCGLHSAVLGWCVPKYSWALASDAAQARESRGTERSTREPLFHDYWRPRSLGEPYDSWTTDSKPKTLVFDPGGLARSKNRGDSFLRKGV
ncbi:hypothetical protein RND81_11G075700 [Saponaria officinalis]|uniref:Uncharacterized protein n=1 Tax=Saponaria officinalis TaxID=3572 RepID=A0AAW1HJ30_SAPOF